MRREPDLFDIFPDLPRPAPRVLSLRRPDMHKTVARTRDQAANIARQKAAAAAVRQRLDARGRRR